MVVAPVDLIAGVLAADKLNEECYSYDQGPQVALRKNCQCHPPPRSARPSQSAFITPIDPAIIFTLSAHVPGLFRTNPIESEEEEEANTSSSHIRLEDH